MARRSRRLTLGITFLFALAALIGAVCAVCSDAASAGQAVAPEPTVVREVFEKRTEYSNTYLLSNGQYRCVTYQAPINYRAADDGWQPIDTSLIPVSGMDVYATAATPIKVTLADEAPGRKPVSVSGGEWTVAMNLVGWSEDEKIIIDDAAVYTNVAPATDVTYTVMGDGLKEVITLSSPAAPNSFTYRLSHPGLELRQGEHGQWALYEPGVSTPSSASAP